jgi:hypothetical protein
LTWALRLTRFARKALASLNFLVVRRDRGGFGFMAYFGGPRFPCQGLRRKGRYGMSRPTRAWAWLL